MEEENKVGRPLKFNSPEELMAKGMTYIEERRKSKKPITVTGLCLESDTNRETLMNYERKDEFFDTIKRLKLYAENYAEEKLFTGRNTIGAIFALKNFGWRDSFEISSKKQPPAGMSEDDRMALRKKVSSFSESFTKKKEIVPVSSGAYKGNT